MKKMLFLSFAFAFFAVATQAQSNNDTSGNQARSGWQRGGQRGGGGMWMKELNLTKDQQVQWKALSDSMMEQRKAIQSNSSLSQEEKRQAMQDLMKKSMDARKAILTPDQQATWDKAMEQMKQRRSQRDSKNSGQ